MKNQPIPNTTQERLAEMRQCAQRLDQLLAQPEFGLMTWHEFVKDNVDRLNAIYSAPPPTGK